MKRFAAIVVIASLIAVSLTMTGCHRLGLIKSNPKHAPASTATTKTGQ